MLVIAYAYINNNPVNGTDPSGHTVDCAIYDYSCNDVPHSIRSADPLPTGTPIEVGETPTLLPGTGQSYDVTAQETFTGFPSAGEFPYTPGAKVPGWLWFMMFLQPAEDALVWVRDNLNIRTPVVSSYVYLDANENGLVITGAGITNTDNEAIGITNFNYTIKDNSGSQIWSQDVWRRPEYVHGPYYGIAIPNASTSVSAIFPVKPILRGQTFVVSISVVSQSGYYGNMTNEWLFR